MSLKFDDNGLIPAIVQDKDNGDILMFAWMNQESVQRTRESRQAWFWSRSRQELWHKGATSGNTLDVDEIRYDCDADVLADQGHAERSSLPHRRAIMLLPRTDTGDGRTTR